MTLYKLNRLHWPHDDVAGRIPIDKRPKLNRESAHGAGAVKDRYGGFYTKDQLRDLVAYAAARFVTIIPEIEMPGHAQAAVASVSADRLHREPVPVLDRFRARSIRLCPSNEEDVSLRDDCARRRMRHFSIEHDPPRRRRVPARAVEKLPALPGFHSRASPGRRKRSAGLFLARVAALVQKHGRRMQGWARSITRA
jgi:hexosaminidase